MVKWFCSDCENNFETKSDFYGEHTLPEERVCENCGYMGGVHPEVSNTGLEGKIIKAIFGGDPNVLILTEDGDMYSLIFEGSKSGVIKIIR